MLSRCKLLDNISTIENATYYGKKDSQLKLTHDSFLLLSVLLYLNLETNSSNFVVQNDTKAFEI